MLNNKLKLLFNLFAVSVLAIVFSLSAHAQDVNLCANPITQGAVTLHCAYTPGAVYDLFTLDVVTSNKSTTAFSIETKFSGSVNQSNVQVVNVSREGQAEIVIILFTSGDHNEVLRSVVVKSLEQLSEERLD
jgi:hypothetical protein